MTCGDFIDLICAWERYNTSPLKRQNSDLNLKKARSFNDSDSFRTPTSNHDNYQISDFSKITTSMLKNDDLLFQSPIQVRPELKT